MLIFLGGGACCRERSTTHNKSSIVLDTKENKGYQHMHPKPFDKPGRFLRGNLHTHSNRSDGKLKPEEVCRRYKLEGYDFIAITDHFTGNYGYPITDTRKFRDDVFTTILGAELHSGTMENGELWHILAVGLPLDFLPPNSPTVAPVQGQELASEIAQRAADAGAFVSIAHPQWSALTMDDARSIHAAHAVEVYNHGCAVECDRPDGFSILDRLLSEGRLLAAVATDDAHFKVNDHFGGWVMVRAEENKPRALLQALKDGEFYSTQGPQIYGIEVDDSALYVCCSAVSTVIVQAHGSATSVTHGSSMTKASVSLGRCQSSSWIRLTIIDAAGKRAWSNPIWR